MPGLKFAYLVPLSATVGLARVATRLLKPVASLTFKVKVSDNVVLPSVTETVKECEVFVSKSKALLSVTSPVEELMANLLSGSLME